LVADRSGCPAELGFERLAGIAHDSEILAVDDRDMGIAGKAHRMVSSYW
jgi:hypothetical protein